MKKKQFMVGCLMFMYKAQHTSYDKIPYFIRILSLLVYQDEKILIGQPV